MPRFLITLFSIVLMSQQAIAADEVVVEDEGVTLTKSEFAYRVEQWTGQMKKVANEDAGDRLELLNMVMVNKKVAAQADQIAEKYPDRANELNAQIEAYKRDFVLRAFRDNLELPDFNDLAKERYNVEKDKYALIPETRSSSHILISSPPGVPRDDAMAEAEEILTQLRAGADFEQLVVEHSDEPGAAEKKGKFNRWIKFGELEVSPPYSEGVFSIAKVGEYSEPVNTQFGVHVIRLDGIREKSYKPYDEVKDAIIAELKDEYQRLALKEYITRFNLTDDAVVNDAVVMEVLAPYAQPAPEAATTVGEPASTEAPADNATQGE